MREFSVGGDGLTLANQAVTLAFVNPGGGAGGQSRIHADVGFAAGLGHLGAAARAGGNAGHRVSDAGLGDAAAAQARRHRLDHHRRHRGRGRHCGINASAEGAGTKTVKFGDNFNVLNGYLWVALPEEKIIMPAGSASGLGLFLPAAAASLSNWAAGMNFAER
jgi:hypothetical protein